MVGQHFPVGFTQAENTHRETANGAGNAMRMVTTTDGGATWGPLMSVPGATSGLGGQPVVQPNGTVVVPYTANYGAVYAFRSTNGGATWGQNVLVASQTMHSVVGYRALSVDYSESGVHGENGVDYIQHGPVLGAKFNW